MTALAGAVSLGERLARWAAGRLRTPVFAADARPGQKDPTGRERAYAHFKDADGAPTLRDASVVFWDLMGFAAQSDAPRDEAVTALRSLRTAVEEARDRAGTEEAGFLRCSSWFTDNVVLATPILPPQDLELTLGPTFIDLAYMQLTVVRHGYLARGGISFGDVYIDESFVYGPALIEAYRLESQSGPRPPCVAVSDDVARYCYAMAREYWAEPAGSPFGRELVIDADTEEVFVDHLGIWLDEEDDPRSLEYWLPVFRDVILDQLTTLKQRSRPWTKWRWLADYHDWALRSRGLGEPDYLVGRRAKHRFLSMSEVLLAADREGQASD